VQVSEKRIISNISPLSFACDLNRARRRSLIEAFKQPDRFDYIGLETVNRDRERMCLSTLTRRRKQND